MRFLLVPILIMLVVNCLIDMYIYSAIVSATRVPLWPSIQKWSAIVLNVMMIVVICLPKTSGSDTMFQFVMWGMFVYLSIYFCKYVFFLLDVVSRVPILFGGTQWGFMSAAGAILGILLLVLLWWGALFSRFDIEVKPRDIFIADLPQGFEGMTIAQISDLHVGTFGKDPGFLLKLVSEINAVEPDMIVFTGDIVNRRSQELVPFMEVLSGLTAPYGVYSIMGNHDYGDYSQWPSISDKLADVRNLKEMQRKMGWKMLNNEHVLLERGGDTLALIGVENVGDPPFHIYGDLRAAYPDLSDSRTKILLSHNPAHWVDSIKTDPDANIALTLSGHTHAMQFRLFGASPASLRYPTWGGLYTDSLGRQLYVNIGAGTVGFPARIGATPEITLFTLRRE